jgi:hypothetical protein
MYLLFFLDPIDRRLIKSVDLPIRIRISSPLRMLLDALDFVSPDLLSPALLIVPHYLTKRGLFIPSSALVWLVSCPAQSNITS